MRVRLVGMDFDGRWARLEVDPPVTPDGAANLADVVQHTRSHGMRRVDVALGPGIDPSDREIIGRLVRARGGRLSRPTRRGAGRSLAPNAVVARPDAEQEPIIDAYHVRLTEMPRVLNNVTATTTILSHCAALDEYSAGRMRLALYELAVNTVEHATFAHDQPEIRIAIRLAAPAIDVTYEDNANMFVTGEPPAIDLARKITAGARRGLGLFILNRLAESLSYQRRDGWNVTTMTLAYGDVAAEHRRRFAMDGLKVELVPCHLPNTVVVKPIGSIDSATIHVLESQLEAVVATKKPKIVIDMSAVAFVSSAGIGVFLGNVSLLRAAGGDLIFMKTPRHVVEVFEIINMSSYFVMIDSLEELQGAERR